MGEAIEVQRVIGFSHTQVVVTSTIFFLRNCRVVIADEVLSIRKVVLVDTCKVLFDKVLLTGRLRKDVTFREAATCLGNTASVGGARAEVDFQAILDVRGARPGDSCVVVKAFVEGENEKPLTQTPGGGIKGLLESSVLFLCVKVVRATIMENHHHQCDDRSDSSSSDDSSCSDDSSTGDSGDDRSGSSGSVTWSPTNDQSSSSSESGHLDPCNGFECKHPEQHRKRKDRHCKGCPKRRTTGLVAGGTGGVPDAQPGAIPGSFIGPTILFPGIF